MSEDYRKGFRDGVARAEAMALMVWVVIIAGCVGWLVVLVTAPLPTG